MGSGPLGSASAPAVSSSCERRQPRWQPTATAKRALRVARSVEHKAPQQTSGVRRPHHLARMIIGDDTLTRTPWVRPAHVVEAHRVAQRKHTMRFTARGRGEPTTSAALPRVCATIGMRPGRSLPLLDLILTIAIHADPQVQRECAQPRLREEHSEQSENTHEQRGSEHETGRWHQGLDAQSARDARLR